MRPAVVSLLVALALGACSTSDGDAAGNTIAPSSAPRETAQDPLDEAGGIDGPVLYWRSEVARYGEGAPEGPSSWERSTSTTAASRCSTCSATAAH